MKKIQRLVSASSLYFVSLLGILPSAQAGQNPQQDYLNNFNQRFAQLTPVTSDLSTKLILDEGQKWQGYFTVWANGAVQCNGKIDITYYSLDSVKAMIPNLSLSPAGKPQPDIAYHHVPNFLNNCAGLPFIASFLNEADVVNLSCAPNLKVRTAHTGNGTDADPGLVYSPSCDENSISWEQLPINAKSALGLDANGKANHLMNKVHFNTFLFSHVDVTYDLVPVAATAASAPAQPQAPEKIMAPAPSARGR
jgi:hypothetical protein